MFCQSICHTCPPLQPADPWVMQLRILCNTNLLMWQPVVRFLFFSVQGQNCLLFQNGNGFTFSVTHLVYSDMAISNSRTVSMWDYFSWRYVFSRLIHKLSNFTEYWFAYKKHEQYLSTCKKTFYREYEKNVQKIIDRNVQCDCKLCHPLVKPKII